MVNGVKTFIKDIKSVNWNIFDLTNNKTSSTQRVGEISENFVINCLKKCFTNIKIFQMSSQEHPDLMILNKRNFNDFDNNIKLEIQKREKENKSSKNVLENYQKTIRGKRLFVKIEIKTSESGVYTLNDTFPEPEKSKDVIYVLFDIRNKKSFISTSNTMAENANFNVKEKLDISKNILKKFKADLSNNWQSTPIKTAARPTYRMNLEYANIDTPLIKLESIFKKSNII